MMDEIDFIAEYPKADMSKVNTIRVNGKEYVSIDRVLEIIISVNTDYVIKRNIHPSAVLSWSGAIDEIEKRVKALKGGEE